MGFFSGLDTDKYDRLYDDRKLFGRLWDYMKPHSRLAWLTIITSVMMAIIYASYPILYSMLIGELEGRFYSQTISLLLVAFLGIALLEYGTNFGLRLSLNKLVAFVTAAMRKDAFAATIARDMAFFDENKSGKVLSRITHDTDDFAQVFTFTFELIVQVSQFLIIIVALLRQSVRLTLLLFAFIPVIFAIAIVIRNKARDVTRQGSRAMAKVNDNIQESVSGISVAKNFRREAMVYDEFTDVNQLSYKINLKRGMILALVFPVFNMLGGVAIAIIMYFTSGEVITGAISLAVWTLFMQATNRFWGPVINIASFWSQFQQALADLERVFALIDATNTVNQTGDGSADHLKGEIVFDRVDFHYKAEQEILENFSLTISKGESVAIVGHTGAGKTSLVNLLTRFYEFQGGRILIDRQDIRSFDLRDYRQRLGLVPQQPFLFNGTILENMRYARPEATDEELETIAHSIGGGEWLETLPDGLMTDVGERGARLSMGQRQLVSLLRVLVQKPLIFILDEATASIDPFTEMQIQQALEMILSRSTSIMIAHRLSTVRRADRIIVLRDGKIIEEGNHDALMSAGGHYAELYDTYFRHQSLSYVETARQRLMTGDPD